MPPAVTRYRVTRYAANDKSQLDAYSSRNACRTRGLIELAQGRTKEALTEFLADPDVAARDGGTALVSHAFGKKGESDAALTRVIKERGKAWPFNIARIHAYRGEKDQVFDWLEKAYVASDVELEFVLDDPYLAPLHKDPRWSVLMKKMNLARD